MSYTALYRKFRPANFDEVKGQDHIVTTLRNQINAERIGHAYLFCGTRGTGKTSIAKIFAKAVNCENPVNGSPCGECKICKAIAAGASMNVIEIDAASNNGVDNIREIVDEVSYSPVEGKYKVYIIDEVHMLSIGAFNALLKTLEEPPEYVIFILATTEVHKIPITILSRCQRYDFKRINIDTITNRLQDLMEQEQVKVEEKALRYIAKTADGSMRDALSLLDQCIAFHFGEELTYDKALEVLGAVDTGVFSKLLRAIMEKNVLHAIEILEDIVIQGRELTQFINDFTWYLRNLLLVKTSEQIEDVIDVSTETRIRLQEEADEIAIETIMRYMRIFSELSGQLRFAAQKRIMVEMAIIKICRPSMEQNQDSLLERIRDLEEKIEKGVVLQASGVVQSSEETSGQGMPAKKTDIPLPKAIPDDIKRIVNNWSGIVAETDNPLKTYLKGARLSLSNDNKLILVVEDGIGFDYLKNPEHQTTIENMLSSYLEKEVEVVIQSIASNQNFEDSYVDLSQVVHMDIEIVEDDE